MAAVQLSVALAVLKLRSEYGEPKKELTDPAKYYDLTYYQRAPQGR